MQLIPTVMLAPFTLTAGLTLTGIASGQTAPPPANQAPVPYLSPAPASQAPAGAPPAQGAPSQSQQPAQGQQPAQPQPAQQPPQAQPVQGQPPAQGQPTQPTQQQYAAQPQAQGAVPYYNAPSEEVPEEPEVEKRKFYTMLLVEAVAKYGSVGREGTGLDENRDGRSTGMFGGQLTLGLLPGGKYFTMAARLAGGSFVSGGTGLGTLGASMMFGAHFLRNEKGNTFSYALAGAGVEFMPAINEDMLAFHVAGGTVVRGVSFSAGIDVGGNDDVGFALFGMQLGWGQLF